MATNKLRKGVDEQVLEGGIGGASAGYRSARGANEKRLQESMDNMSAKERAALDNPGKQFESSTPKEPSGTARMGRSEVAKRVQSMTPEEREVLLGNPGKQFEAKKKGGVVSASKRADGIAKRGKTRGKVL